MLIVKFSNAQSIPINDTSYFTLVATQFQLERDEKGNYKFAYNKIDYTNCSFFYDQFVLKNQTDYYNTNNLKDGFCFNTSLYNFTIGGAFPTRFFSNINYKVNKCVNSTSSKIICKPIEQINKMLTIVISNYIILTNILIQTYMINLL